MFEAQRSPFLLKSRMAVTMTAAKVGNAAQVKQHCEHHIAGVPYAKGTQVIEQKISVVTIM